MVRCTKLAALGALIPVGALGGRAFASAAGDAPVRGPMIDLRHLRDHWGASGQFPVEWALIAFGLFVSVMALAAYLRWRRQRRLQSRPLWVFNQVARSVGLSWTQRWLLIRIARERHLPGPLTLLVCPATLEHHAARYAEGRPGRAGDLRTTVQRIRQRAFEADDAG